jgi:hypothetical protein
MTVSMPIIAVAQSAVPHRPAKAAPNAPLAKPAFVATVVKQSAVAPLPTKPTVVTAVAPKHPISGTHRSIIFVGGKPRSGNNVELNPQPIPPGRGGPGDPIR